MHSQPGAHSYAQKRKRKRKTTPFDVNLMRSQISYRAAQHCYRHYAWRQNLARKTELRKKSHQARLHWRQSGCATNLCRERKKWSDEDCMVWTSDSEEELPWSIDPNTFLTCVTTLACIISGAAQQIAECIERLLTRSQNTLHSQADNVHVAIAMKLTCRLQAWLELDLEWPHTKAAAWRGSRTGYSCWKA